MTDDKDDNPNYYPDGSPKPRTYFSVFSKIVTVALLIAAPFVIYTKPSKKDKGEWGRGGD